jgi:hypothetical protein
MRACTAGGRLSPMHFQGRVAPTPRPGLSQHVAQCVSFVVFVCVGTSTIASAAPQCNLSIGVLSGAGFHSQPAANVSECCAACFAEGHCAAFTFYSANTTCVLKESVGGLAT